jgi:hypothetical protein
MAGYLLWQDDRLPICEAGWQIIYCGLTASYPIWDDRKATFGRMAGLPSVAEWQAASLE